MVQLVRVIHQFIYTVSKIWCPIPEFHRGVIRMYGAPLSFDPLVFLFTCCLLQPIGLIGREGNGPVMRLLAAIRDAS